MSIFNEAQQEQTNNTEQKQATKEKPVSIMNGCTTKEVMSAWEKSKQEVYAKYGVTS